MTFYPHKHIPNACGFSLVVAIFVLVVLSALGIFIVTIGEVQRSLMIAAAQGARANYAAQSGLEWGIFQAVPPAPGVSSCVAAPPAFSPSGTGLTDFSVRVTCTSTPYDEGANTVGGGNPIVVYVITSTATFGTFGTRDYFSRTLQVTVTNAP